MKGRTVEGTKASRCPFEPPPRKLSTIHTSQLWHTTTSGRKTGHHTAPARLPSRQSVFFRIMSIYERAQSTFSSDEVARNSSGLVRLERDGNRYIRRNGTNVILFIVNPTRRITTEQSELCDDPVECYRVSEIRVCNRDAQQKALYRGGILLASA